MMEFQSNKVIVTGALGWLGISLVESLVRGHADHDVLKQPGPDLRIRCLVLPGQNATSLRKISDHIEVVSGDIRNPVTARIYSKIAKEQFYFIPLE